MNKLKRTLGRVHRWVWVVIILLIAIRLLLPVGIKYTINWYLDKKLVSYQGHINDFDLALYRGAYQIEDLKIWKRTKSPEHPFIDIQKIDLSLAWRALFKGKFLGDLEVKGARLDLVDSDQKNKKQTGQEEDWKTLAGHLVPIELESFALVDSEIHFINNDFKVPVEVVLDRIYIDATNIKNINDSKDLLPSRVAMKARFQKNAQLTGEARLNLLSRIPIFQSKAELEKFDITKLNNFFLAYGPFTFNRGSFSFLAEVSSRDNQIKGYVKPFFSDVKVMSPNEHFGTPKRFFNEIGLAMANMILRDHKDKTVATTIEFAGSSKGPDIEKWHAFWGALRNGWVEALQKKWDNNVTIKDVPAKGKP